MSVRIPRNDIAFARPSRFYNWEAQPFIQLQAHSRMLAALITLWGTHNKKNHRGSAGHRWHHADTLPIKLWQPMLWTTSGLMPIPPLLPPHHHILVRAHEGGELRPAPHFPPIIHRTATHPIASLVAACRYTCVRAPGKLLKLHISIVFVIIIFYLLKYILGAISYSLYTCY